MRRARILTRTLVHLCLLAAPDTRTLKGRRHAHSLRLRRPAGTGKSTLARRLAADRGSVYLRIDTIEQTLRDAGLALREPRRLPDRLRGRSRQSWPWTRCCRRLGQSARDRAQRLARRRGALQRRIRRVEVICSDAAEHRSRVEARSSDIPHLRLPTWSDVVQREYEPWDRPHIIIDTSGQSVGQSLAALERSLSPDNRRATPVKRRPSNTFDRTAGSHALAGPVNVRVRPTERDLASRSEHIGSGSCSRASGKRGTLSPRFSQPFRRRRCLNPTPSTVGPCAICWPTSLRTSRGRWPRSQQVGGASA